MRSSAVFSYHERKTLAEEIERVYTAFADVPRPKQIKQDSYGLQPGEVKQLLTYPLRELSPGLMRSYLFDAIYRTGSWDDFRYFLPRLLELLPEWEVEPEPVSWQLEYANNTNRHKFGCTFA